MAYVGQQPQYGDYKKLDSISSSFNGVLTQFEITSGGTPVYINSANQLIISVNGVVCEPGVAFDVGTTPTSLVFLQGAPPTGSTFFGVLLSTAIDIGAPGDGTVSSLKLQANAVTAVKILDDAVETSKLANGAVTTTKIADGAATTAKIGDGAITTVKQADNSITTAKIVDGTITLSKIANSIITFAKLAASAIASQVQAEAGTATDVLMTPQRVKQAIDIFVPPLTVPKVVVKFNGATGAILGTSVGVSSVTDLGTGEFRINFSTNFANTNYICLATAEASSGNGTNIVEKIKNASQLVSSITIITGTSGNTPGDVPAIHVVCYGTQ
jgi:hypothetical protein